MGCHGVSYEYYDIPPRGAVQQVVYDLSSKCKMWIGAKETMENLVGQQDPSRFYALFEGSIALTLHFPVGPDGGPIWDSQGQLDLSICPETTDEDVSVVDLGAGRYRLAERRYGPFSDLRMYWGDEFTAEKQSDGSLSLRQVILPGRFHHYRFMGANGFNNDDPVAVIVHALEGGWETVAGGMLTITIPTFQVSEFERLLYEQQLSPGFCPLEV